MGWTSIVASISTVAMMIIALFSLKNSIVQFSNSNEFAQKQIELIQRQLEETRIVAYSQLPASINIEPKDFVENESGVYNFSVINHNLYDLLSIGICVNLYKGCWNDNTPITISSSYISTLPAISTDTILSKNRFSFSLNQVDLMKRITNIGDKKNHV